MYDGTWWVSLNNQRDWKARLKKDCSGYKKGLKGAELWAERHEDCLRAEIDRLRVARSAPKGLPQTDPAAQLTL